MLGLTDASVFAEFPKKNDEIEFQGLKEETLPAGGASARPAARPTLCEALAIGITLSPLSKISLCSPAGAILFNPDDLL